jgi:hypothetical protein
MHIFETDGQAKWALLKESPMNEAGLVHLSQEKDRLAEVLMMNWSFISHSIRLNWPNMNVLTTSFHLGRNAPIGRSLYINKFEKEYTTSNAYI